MDGKSRVNLQKCTLTGQHKAGSTGKSIPGSEIKIENPDRDGNGEICYRGRHIFMGYMHDEETTGKTIDKGTGYKVQTIYIH